MKTCEHCKSEIAGKAKRCPQCQGDLRIWPSRHKITFTQVQRWPKRI